MTLKPKTGSQISWFRQRFTSKGEDSTTACNKRQLAATNGKKWLHVKNGSFNIDMRALLLYEA